jgi:DNA modification methylase
MSNRLHDLRTAPCIVGQIELRPVDQLLPCAHNARTHSKAQILQIAESVREFGFVNPVLVGPDNQIIAGHARLRAARQLGMREVPVIVLGHLSKTQSHALMLADNQLALNAGWDDELLRAALAALAEEEFPMELIGFDQAELARLLADQAAAEGLTDSDAAPPVPALPVSMPGDLWTLGEHRLLCGDATQAADLATVLAGDKAAMVFTDPPYNVGYEGKTKRRLRIENDALGGKFQEFLQEACTRLMEVCQGGIYICMSSSELHTLYQAFTEAGGHWSTFLIWSKNHFTLGRSDYQRQYETILYGWPQGVAHYWCGARNQGDVWSVARPVANREHPTMKPVELVERAVQNSSQVGDTVLDPFAGSGTTLIACERLKRRARLVEVDARYVDVICQRWEQYRGQSAVLDGDGRLFGEIAQARQKKAA